MQRPIRIGLLGASRIAVPAIVMPAETNTRVEVTAVAASNPERANAYAAEHGIPCVEAGYAALVESREVDLVYNALPPRDHLEWSLAALQAGKHVLCEKPFSMNATEAATMVGKAAASGQILIEALHYRFHPLFKRVLEIVRSGRIGEVRSLSARFNVPIPFQPGELRHERALGGGAMMDLGCYPLHWARTLMADEPVVLEAAARRGEADVDIAMEATLKFPGGARAEVRCSMADDLQPGLDTELVVSATKGSLIVNNLIGPLPENDITVERDGEILTETVSGSSTYVHQLEHVIAVLAGAEPPLTGGADAVANMVATDAIYRAAGFL